MPCFNVGDDTGVHSRGRRFGEGDLSGGTVKDIETRSRRESTPNNDFVLIRDPAVLRSEGHEAIAIAGERRHRDKARATGRNEKNIAE
jgi:hypothetical protein